MRERNVILVGFMGAGKSVCGRMLAKRLGRCFVETDDMITAREGCTIPEIFARHGEARFRQLEAEAVAALALKAGDVIATGGGLPCREGMMDTLRTLGTVVWLRGEPLDLLKRARRQGARPMLDGRSDDDVVALHRAREAFYRQAHLTIDTTGRTIDQVVGDLVAALRTDHARV
ncbi:MAG: shikimate kinase [Candidatus Rokubacteria bacterium]|nr:shikimate kinase [Candidatus Rokubacteria bacterium]